MRIIILLMLIVWPLLSYTQSVTLRMLQETKVNYESIVLLSESDTNWLDVSKDDVEGIAYRFILTREDIYNRAFIEKITYGIEGCCKSICYIKEISLEELFKKYNLVGEIAAVEFRNWLDDKSFNLLIQEKIYTITLIDDTMVNVVVKANV
jgi:hypothetical protein